MMPPSLHSALSPSKLDRYLRCPAAFTLEGTLPASRASNAAAVEGTMLHSAMERALYMFLFDQVKPTSKEVARALSIEANQANLVHDCYEEIYALYKPHMEIYIEQRVHLVDYEHSLYECSGTPDVILVDREAEHLWVIDWKFGRYGPLSVTDNPQLWTYGAGALKLVGPSDNYDVTLMIVQPQLSHVDTDTVHAQSIVNWVKSTLIPGVARIMSPNPAVCPGSPQCDWCGFSPRCAELHKARVAQAQRLFSLTELELPLEQLHEVYRELRAIGNQANSVMAYIEEQMLEHNIDIPGFSKVRGRGGYVWTLAEDELAAELNQFIPMEEVYESKIISPHKAKKLLAKEDYVEISKFIERKPGRLKIVEGTQESSAVETFKNFV